MKPRLPKRLPPEKRMRIYDESIPQEEQKWIEFRIVVPDEETKQQLQAAFEYLHDNRLIDTDFMAVNAAVHSYLEPPDSISPFVVDSKLFNKLKKSNI